MHVSLHKSFDKSTTKLKQTAWSEMCLLVTTASCRIDNEFVAKPNEEKINTTRWRQSYLSQYTIHSLIFRHTGVIYIHSRASGIHAWILTLVQKMWPMPLEDINEYIKSYSFVLFYYRVKENEARNVEWFTWTSYFDSFPSDWERGGTIHIWDI